MNSFIVALSTYNDMFSYLVLCSGTSTSARTIRCQWRHNSFQSVADFLHVLRIRWHPIESVNNISISGSCIRYVATDSLKNDFC